MVAKKIAFAKFTPELFRKRKAIDHDKTIVGTSVGSIVGTIDGNIVGTIVGTIDGSIAGTIGGRSDGTIGAAMLGPVAGSLMMAREGGFSNDRGH